MKGVDSLAFAQRPAPWTDYAACAGVDPELFFPGRGESLRPARAVCARCVVRAQCLEHAITNEEHHGVWGGTSERERRRIRRQRGLIRRTGEAT